MTAITYFNLHPPDSERLLAQHVPYQEKVLRCPTNPEHVDGRQRISDLALTVGHNDRSQSIIWPWIPDGCVVHKWLLKEFERASFTGFRVRPASVRFKDGVVSDEYHELVVTGWAGIARPESGIRVVESCPACHWKRYSGLKNAEELIDWTQWTKEDFFIVWPFGSSILITERVSELLLTLKVKSFELRGLQDVPPIIADSGFTVARLSSFIPEDLAIRYGCALGLE